MTQPWELQPIQPTVSLCMVRAATVAVFLKCSHRCQHQAVSAARYHILHRDSPFSMHHLIATGLIMNNTLSNNYSLIPQLPVRPPLIFLLRSLPR
jgi:hypothetical protein